MDKHIQLTAKKYSVIVQTSVKKVHKQPLCDYSAYRFSIKYLQW